MPKILIADDSLSVRKVAERLLTAAGLEVTLVANGEEALSWLVKGRPDLVLADIIMPDKSGFDVCTYIRSHQGLSATPVLLMSGVVDDEVSRQAEACRANGVIKKPFQGASLQERVMALLAASQEQVSAPAAAAVETPIEMAAAMAAIQPPETSRPSPEQPASPKVFRITEEQLQTVRQAAAWAKETEAKFAEEQQRTARLEEQVQRLQREIEELRHTAEEAGAHAHELEVRLAAERQRVEELQVIMATVSQNGQPSTEAMRELQSRLSEEEQRSAQLVKQLAEKEHAASCAERLAQAFAEITALGKH